MYVYSYTVLILVAHSVTKGANKICERNSKGQKPMVTQTRSSMDRLKPEKKGSLSSLIYLTLASIRCVFIAATVCFDRSH